MIVLAIFALMQPIDLPVEFYKIEVIYTRDKDPSLAIVEKLSLIDPSGSVKWTRAVGFPVAAYPLADGAALLACEQAPEGWQIELQFVDPSGDIVNTHKVKYFQGAHVSKNLEAVLVHTAERVILYSSTGEKIVEYEGKFSQVTLDATGSRVALTSGRTLYVYSRVGETASEEISNPYVRELEFSNLGTRVAVLTASSLELWHQVSGIRTLPLASYQASPKRLGFDRYGERILVVLKDEKEFKLLSLDCADLSTLLYTRPLASPDETVIRVIADGEGWLLQLTSGWYRLAEEQR
jgi:hypothetical protein